MRILEPEFGKGKNNIQYIVKNNIYIKITDYFLKSFLKEIIIGPGQHIWYWIPFDKDKAIDINPNHSTVSSFDDCINRTANDPYSTLYEFETYDEVVKNWDKIKYNIDRIPTIYKGENSKESTNI